MNMTDSKFIDSSIWIEYLIYSKFQEIIKSEEFLLTSVLSLFEIKRKLERLKIKKEDVEKSIKFIESKSIIILIDSQTAKHAAEMSIKYNLAAIDALIYSSSVEQNATLVTMDHHFKELPQVTILE